MDYSIYGQHDKVECLVQGIRKAKNDSQKCAAVLMVAKLVKANELSAEQRREIFQSIGFTFPLKLLSQSEDNTSDDSSSVFSNLGLSLLASYSTDDTLVHSPELIKAIPLVLKLMKEKCDNDMENDKSAIKDCAYFFTGMTATDAGCHKFIIHSGLEQLVHSYSVTDLEETEQMFWSILHNLIRYDSNAVWETNKEHMLVCLNQVVEKSCNDHNERQFKLFDDLSILLQTLPSTSTGFYYQQTWLVSLVKALHDVLRSKITAKQRNPALILCSRLTELYGLKWLSNPALESENLAKFPVLLLRLTCIEIQMIMYTWKEKRKNSVAELCNAEELPVLLACYLVFESACSTIADFDSGESSHEVFSFDDIKTMQKSLADTVNAVNENLLQTLIDRNECSDLMLACLRTIGSWLNVELFAKSEVGVRIAKSILSVFLICVKKEPSIAVRSFSPAILHYAENATTRDNILMQDVVPVLSDVLTNPELFNETRNLAAQCLMALCLEADDACCFTIVLPRLMENTVKSQPNGIVPSFYISTLALIIWNKLSEVVSNHPHSERFFRSLLHLLHGLHATDGVHIGVAKRYKDVWVEIEELWFILVKELIQAAGKSEELRTFLMQSRLPQKSADLLTCKEHNEIRDCYGLLNSFIVTLHQT